MKQYKKHIKRYNDDLYLEFNGSSQYLESIPTNRAIKHTNDWTLSCFVNLENQVGGQFSTIYNDYVPSGFRGIFIAWSFSNGSISIIRNGVSGNVHLSDVGVGINHFHEGWIHITITYDSTLNEFEIFYDSISIGKFDGVNNDPFGHDETKPIRIGHSIANSSNTYLEGGIRDWCSFDKVLSIEEINYIYETGVPSVSMYDAIQHYYPLNDRPYENGGKFYIKDVAKAYNPTVAGSDIEMVGWDTTNYPKFISYIRDFNHKSLDLDIGLKGNKRYNIPSFNTFPTVPDFSNGYTVFFKIVASTTAIRGNIVQLGGVLCYIYVNSSGQIILISEGATPNNGTSIGRVINKEKQSVVGITITPSSVKTFTDGVEVFNNTSFNPITMLTGNNTSHIGLATTQPYKAWYYTGLIDRILTDEECKARTLDENWLGENPSMMYSAKNNGSNELIELSGNAPNATISINSEDLTKEGVYTNKSGNNGLYTKGLKFDSSKRQFIDIQGLEQFDKSEGYTFISKVDIDLAVPTTLKSHYMFSATASTSNSDTVMIRIDNQSHNLRVIVAGKGVNPTFNVLATEGHEDLDRKSTIVSAFSYVPSGNGVIIDKGSFGSALMVNGFRGHGVAPYTMTNVPSNFGFDEFVNPIFSIGRYDRFNSSNYADFVMSAFTIYKGVLTDEEIKKITNNGFYRSPYEVVKDSSKIILDVDFQNPCVDGSNIRLTDNSGNCTLTAIQKIGTDWTTLTGVQNSID